MRWRPHRFAVVVMVVGLIVTAVLAWVGSLVNGSNEQRLLNLEVGQAAATLQASLPALQANLFGVYKASVATKASSSVFESFSRPALSSRTFVSMSLWELRPAPHQVALIGAPSRLGATPRAAEQLFDHIHPGPLLRVVPFLSGSPRRLGYAEFPVDPASDLVIYAESPLPADKMLVTPKGSPFSDLNFALYLGPSPTPGNLLESSTLDPSPSIHASSTVAFGTTAVDLVGSPKHWLAGALSASLVWIIAAAGALVSLVLAFGVDRVAAGRASAEEIAESRRLRLNEQRQIAETLQNALLPARIPAVAGLEIAVRYLPGVSGLEIGGDWYDIYPVDQDRCTLVVGDVSGRGLAAATSMAALRFGFRAYQVQGDPPAQILDKLDNLLSIEREGQFATIVCAELDVPAHRIAVASAGHLPILLVDSETADFVDRFADPPIGLPGQRPRRSLDVEAPPRCVLYAFTDGLVERRGETIDEGLERLRRCCVPMAGESLDATLTRIMKKMVPGGSDDDVAILGVRWSI